VHKKKWFRIWLVVAVVWWLIAGTGIAFEHYERAEFCNNKTAGTFLDGSFIAPWDELRIKADCKTVWQKSQDGFGPGRLVISGRFGDPGSALVKVNWMATALSLPLIVLALLLIGRRTVDWVRRGT
jgi:hypothetical protein